MPHKKDHKKKEHKKKERKEPRRKKEPKSLYATLAGIVGVAGATGLRRAAKSQKGQEYIAKGKQLALEYKEKLPQLKADLRVVGRGNANKFWRFHKENIEHFKALHGAKAKEELNKAYHAIKHTLNY